jgi:holo-[acyl-carrier protein] synthase
MDEILGMGTHIVECLRIARLIDRHGDLFINRVFTSGEVDYCRRRRRAIQHFSSHWAAKEAVLQALGLRWQRGMSWQDIEIRLASGSRPVVRARGMIREMVEQLRVSELVVSLAHCHTHAVAHALALRRVNHQSAEEE